MPEPTPRSPDSPVPPRSRATPRSGRRITRALLHRLLSVGLALELTNPSRAAPPTVRPPSAGPVAIELRDSHDDRHALRLSPPRGGSFRRTPLGAGWRHDFDIVLTTDGPDLVVHDGTHARHVFPEAATRTRREGARHDGRTPPDGRIVVRDGMHVWARAGGAGDVTFAGSLPVRIDTSDGSVTALHYETGRLVEAVHHDDGGVTRFEYAGGRIDGITFPDRTAYSISIREDGTLRAKRRVEPAECGPDHESSTGTAETDAGTGAHDDTAPPKDRDARCDTDANPPTPSFAGSGITGAVRIDARPHSCGSYFVEQHGTERGSAIENGLDGLPHYAGYSATVRSFPVADFVGAELRVVRSRDLSLPSYDTLPDGLFDRLLRDGDEIARDLLVPLARDGVMSVTESGRSTTLVHRPERPIVLELVVRHGIASVDQRSQIRRAALELASRHGIALRVVEIP